MLHHYNEKLKTAKQETGEEARDNNEYWQLEPDQRLALVRNYNNSDYNNSNYDIGPREADTDGGTEDRSWGGGVRRVGRVWGYGVWNQCQQ